MPEFPMTINDRAARRQSFYDWVAALNSGKYKQAQGQLRDTLSKWNVKRPVYGFCCLGVACDLDLKIRGKRWTVDHLYKADPKHGLDEEMDADWSTGLLQHFGLTKADQKKLIDMNDGDDKGSDPKSFREIAVYIEQKLMPKALLRPYPYRERKRRR